MRAASLALVALRPARLPLGLSDYRAYQLALYFLYAAAAIGVGLCWGRAGFLPLGQAMFFGLAAYLSGLALIAFQDSPIVSVLLLPLAAVGSGLLAYGIGIAGVSAPGESGAYFSMITLALSLLAFQIATSPGIRRHRRLQRAEGHSRAARASTISPPPTTSRRRLLLLVLAFGAWLYDAPIGVLWRALAQNERRLQLFGFDTNAAQGRGLRRQRTDRRHRRRDLCAATGAGHPAGRRLRPLRRPRDLGRGRRPLRACSGRSSACFWSAR